MTSAVGREHTSMRTMPVPACPVCGDGGAMLHDDLTDALFAAGGRWSIRACQTTDCGTAWLDPRPVADDLGKAYAEYYTHPDTAARPTARWDDRLFAWLRAGYLARHFGHRRQAVGSVRRWLGELLRLHPDLAARVDLQAFHLQPRPGGRFLEIGCGSGDHLATMLELGWNAQGIDLDPGAVATAQARGLPVQQGTIAAQGFAPRSFDAIGLCHVIEHVDDPAEQLRACHELLVPGGQLVLVTPNVRSFGHARFGRHWLALDPPRHLRLYTCASLRRTVQAAGFTITAAKTTFRAAGSQFLASRSIRATGHWTWGSRSGLGASLAARALQLRAYLGLRSRPESGEEIVLVARRG